MKHHKTLNSKIAFTSHMFKVEAEEVELNSGKVAFRDRVVHPGAVVILPQLTNGNLLLVRQYRHPIRKELIEFPAGTIEAAEFPMRCAERELEEEVGRKAKEWVQLGQLYPAPGFCSEIQHLFLARWMTEVEQKLDEDELINEVLEMSPIEIEEKIKSCEITDGKTIASYFRAKLQGYL